MDVKVIDIKGKEIWVDVYLRSPKEPLIIITGLEKSGQMLNIAGLQEIKKWTLFDG